MGMIEMNSLEILQEECRQAELIHENATKNVESITIIKGIVARFRNKDNIYVYIKLTGMSMGTYTSSFATDCIATFPENKVYAKNRLDFFEESGVGTFHELIEVDIHIPVEL